MRRSPDGTTAPDGRPRSEQQKWRRDFPIDWPEDEYVSRRDLVKFLVLTSFAFTGGHIWLLAKQRGATAGASGEYEPRAIARLDELPIGGAKVFEFPPGSSPRLLVRVSQAELVAYDQQCTHLLCPVLPRPEQGKLHCPCHNGWFDLATGRPLAGPPRRPLPRVTVEVRDGVVWATGVEGESA
jgi:Rieske Fe-S protein